MAGSASTPLLSTPDANRAELGEDDEIQAMEGTEWHVVQSKSAKKKQAMERGIRNAPPSSHDCVQKIIVRPRDGLDLRRTSCYGISTAIFTAAGITAIQASSDVVCPNIVQNIVVVCTVKEDNARKILALKNIRVNGKEHEVAVYAAAGGNYVKGVIRNVERDIGDAELERLIIHQGNPSVRGVKRIKDTGSVVVLFDGEDVPSYIRVGQAIVRCYLYKKQMEVCSKCTRVGHRADVCPTAMVNVCRNCGAKDPKQGHSCQIRCKLCGKGHPTGDKACKQKYQIPFVIRQRRKEREMERAFDMDLRDFPTNGAEMTAPSSGGWLQPFTMGGGPVLPVTAKWASKDKNPEPYRTQAGPSTQVSGGTVTAKESEELQKVRNENAKLSSELAQVKKELASLKNAVSLSSHDGDQNGANGRKRRAVGDVPEVDVTDSLNQIKESLKHISSTLQELTKDIAIVKAQNRFPDCRLRDLECKTGLPEPAPLPTELSQLISDPTIVAELVQKQIPCTPSDPKAQSNRRYKGPPNDYEDWIETLFSDVSASTKEIETDDDFPTMDSHLAHLFEAKKALRERWLKNKLNRSLRKRIAMINAEISSYSKVLEQKHWVEMCDKVDGQMRVGGKWNLLKHLLKPTGTRAAQRSAIEILVHRALTLRSKDSIMTDLARIHLPQDTTSFVAAVVDMSGRTVSAASVRTRSIGVAEQVAISLALTTKDPYPIFSDSMTAVMSFDASQISFAARSILTKSTVFPHEEPVKRSGIFGSRPLRGRCPPRVLRNPQCVGRVQRVDLSTIIDMAIGPIATQDVAGVTCQRVSSRLRAIALRTISCSGSARTNVFILCARTTPTTPTISATRARLSVVLLEGGTKSGAAMVNVKEAADRAEAIIANLPEKAQFGFNFIQSRTGVKRAYILLVFSKPELRMTKVQLSTSGSYRKTDVGLVGNTKECKE
ncbi:hypothetical protein HPB50_005468 [Hyalomma asiaticum]|uniref:Uncharacterized protein n=1 Tax=Hyalomma asiaticum TaxID=266040 RepID=A0ACB7SVH1_HYAAI|nr:hypothetical protein HPB50_005468 [Hyalomma asiaticum]